MRACVGLRIKRTTMANPGTLPSRDVDGERAGSERSIPGPQGDETELETRHRCREALQAHHGRSRPGTSARAIHTGGPFSELCDPTECGLLEAVSAG